MPWDLLTMGQEVEANLALEKALDQPAHDREPR